MSNVAGIPEITQYIPAKYRTAIYTTLLVVCLLVACATGGLVAAGIALPKWLVAVNAALAPLNAAAHYLAKRNVAPETPSAPR